MTLGRIEKIIFFTNIYDIFRFFSNNPWKMPYLWWLVHVFRSGWPMEIHTFSHDPAPIPTPEVDTPRPPLAADTPRSLRRRWFFLAFGYGSIAIDTFFKGMNIHKSQLFWCEQKGYKVLTHCHFIVSWCELIIIWWNMWVKHGKRIQHKLHLHQPVITMLKKVVWLLTIPRKSWVVKMTVFHPHWWYWMVISPTKKLM